MDYVYALFGFIVGHRKEIEDFLLIYGGVLIRMIHDYNKWTLGGLVSYSLVGGLVAFVASTYAIRFGLGFEVVSFISLVAGFCGQTIIRFILEDFALDVLRAIKAKVLEKIQSL